MAGKSLSLTRLTSILKLWPRAIIYLRQLERYWTLEPGIIMELMWNYFFLCIFEFEAEIQNPAHMGITS